MLGWIKNSSLEGNLAFKTSMLIVKIHWYLKVYILHKDLSEFMLNPNETRLAFRFKRLHIHIWKRTGAWIKEDLHLEETLGFFKFSKSIHTTKKEKINIQISDMICIHSLSIYSLKWLPLRPKSKKWQ